MKRLFTFGCSYTQYDYPTWANYLGAGFDQHIQYGRTGSGNKRIFNSFINSLEKYNIDSDDYVAISWTSLLRVDKIFNKDNDWSSAGNIFSQTLYSDSWVDKYFNILETGSEFIGYVKSVLSFRKSIGFNLLMLSMSDYEIPKLYGEPSFVPFYRIAHQDENYIKYGIYDTIEKLEKLYFLPSICSTTTKKDSKPSRWQNNCGTIYEELHPLSETYLKYVDSILKPKLDFNFLDKKLFNEFKILSKRWDDYCKNLEAVKNNKLFENLIFPHILTGTEYIYETVPLYFKTKN